MPDMTHDRRQTPTPADRRGPSTPADRHKTPLPKVMTVAEFHQQFGTQEACLARLKDLRWGADLQRFACPACGHAKGWWLPKRELVECRDCHHQVSVTAGTVFHRLRSPLWKWFWAVYQLAQDKKGIAAFELAKQIGVSYTTAWLMLHKLRRAMRQRNQDYVLQGLVEVDECYVGGDAEGTGTTGRGVANKTPVAVALELNDSGKAVEKFPWIHTFIGNMKRMILGTHHSVSPKHLADYLAEFAYRANRRWLEAHLFDRLLVAAVSAKAVTYKQLVTGGS